MVSMSEFVSEPNLSYSFPSYLYSYVPILYLVGHINIFLITFYLQALQIHSANGVKLLEA
jgi:hypothetical protein